jgi:large subunit ribosomal protein L24
VSVSRIKKNDTVIATKGVSAGRTGKVMQVQVERGRAIVEGLRLVKKAIRKTQDNPKGGIVDREGPISLANLLPYCPECKKGVKVRRVQEGESTIRKCRKCGHPFDK